MDTIRIPDVSDVAESWSHSLPLCGEESAMFLREFACAIPREEIGFNKGRMNVLSWVFRPAPNVEVTVYGCIGMFTISERVYADNAIGESVPVLVNTYDFYLDGRRLIADEAYVELMLKSDSYVCVGGLESMMEFMEKWCDL